MSGTLTSTFTERLAGLDVEVTAGPPEDCRDLIDDVAGEPAVGVPLGDADLSLPARVDTDPTAAALRAAHTGVTAAEIGVADYGSVAIRSDPNGTEPVSLFVDHHVVVLHERDLVSGMREAFEWLGPNARDEDADVVFATGPSATADMGDLVTGAHGPKTVHVVLVTDDGADKRTEVSGR